MKASELGPEDAKFPYIAACAEHLDRLDRIILAVDSDSPGLALAEELARRLGKERCWRVRWPDSGDVHCKDANDVLLMHGAEVSRECIEAAEPYPIAGCIVSSNMPTRRWRSTATAAGAGSRLGGRRSTNS